MRKSNLAAGMLVVTANGKVRLVVPTKVDGLVLVTPDNKMMKVSKIGDDLTRGSYKQGNDIVKVYDVMNTVDAEIFGTNGRTLIFYRTADVDVFASTDTYTTEETYEDTYEEYDCDEDGYDCDEDDYDCEETTCSGSDCATCTCSTPSTFTKANVTPGMLAVTRDGQNRLAIPTADMGLVLATEDSKFVRLDKMNDDLTIADYRKEGKNVDEVYGLANGVTTDFYSTANRPLLFRR